MTHCITTRTCRSSHGIKLMRCPAGRKDDHHEDRVSENAPASAKWRITHEILQPPMSLNHQPADTKVGQAYYAQWYHVHHEQRDAIVRQLQTIGRVLQLLLWDGDAAAAAIQIVMWQKQTQERRPVFATSFQVQMGCHVAEKR